MTSTLPRVELNDSPSGQWRLETGVGRLRTFAPNGPRYVEVTIDAPPLASPVTGWADRGAEPFMTLFAHGLGHAAIELHDVDVEYRVEVRRRQDVDPRLPLEVLEAHQKRRRMVWLAPVSHDEPAPAAAEPEPAEPSPSEVDWDRADQVNAAAGVGLPVEWDLSEFNAAPPPVGEYAWHRYRTALQAFAARRAQQRELEPSRVASEDQLVAAVSGWMRSLGLPADERTVFTLIAALSLLQAGLVLNGRLCVDVSLELDHLLSTFSLLVPESVIADA